MDQEAPAITLPRTGRLQMDIRLSTEVNVTAVTARRRVSRLVVSEIGNLLYGGEPSLVVSERICWRVPIWLAYPDTGPIGQVGALDVDVETGEVLVRPQQITAIGEYAHYLAQRTPPDAA